MYFKKQLLFSAFIGIILIVLFFKQNQTQKDSLISELVMIQVDDKVCDYRRMKNSSYMIFKYQNKEYRKSLSKEKCLKIVEHSQIELYYSAETDTFYFEEIFEAGHFKLAKIFLICILVLGLIPYKKFVQ
ncbi:hypothetical protein [Spongiimicrobium salis]|uniref:hypothetical protein n=1 Tax=Spongiimicrobium salis TaxID=1667022 RepID=UPI00374D5C70